MNKFKKKLKAGAQRIGRGFVKMQRGISKYQNWQEKNYKKYGPIKKRKLVDPWATDFSDLI